MSLRAIPLLIMMLCVTGTAFAKDMAAVFEFEGIGVSQSEADAATQIFRGELDATGIIGVIPRGDVESKLAAQGIQSPVCHGVGCAADYGQAAGATESVIGTLTKLGDHLTVEVQLVDVAGRQIVFSDRFTAASLDDMEATLRQLAAAVASRRRITSEVAPSPGILPETSEPAHKRMNMTAGFALGGGGPLGKSYAQVSNLNQVMFVTRYEPDRFVVEASFGVQWGSGGPRHTVDDPDLGLLVVNKQDVYILPLDIGLRYVFNRSDFAPFAGGGVGLHFVNVTFNGQVAAEDVTQTGTAVAFHAAAGFYAFQSYDFRLSLEGRYSVMFSDDFGDDQKTHQQVGILIGIARKWDRSDKRREGCGARWLPW